MSKFNVHWVEMHNVEIEADNRIQARMVWNDESYDRDSESIDLLDDPEIEEIDDE